MSNEEKNTGQVHDRRYFSCSHCDVLSFNNFYIKLKLSMYFIGVKYQDASKGLGT